MIRSKNLDPEAGKWTEPVKLASSTTASFAFKNPTANKVLVDKVVINVTTAAASKTLYVGVSTGATATNAANEVIDAQPLTSSQTIISDNAQVVAAGSYLVGTLNATDSTLVAYAYVHYKELTK